jgi:hypothetical protein
MRTVFRYCRVDRQVCVRGKELVGISTQAPIYAALDGKRAGDAISFNGKGVRDRGGRLRAATPKVESCPSA